MNSIVSGTPFEAPAYAQWGRRLFQILPSHPDATLLFDSNMAEPTALLHGHIRAAYDADLMDRMKSTFGGGNPLLIAQLAARYRVQPESLLCTTGCMSAIQLICRTFLGRGTHAVVETPHFDPLSAFAADSGAEVTLVPRRSGDFQLDPDRIRAALRPDTRLVVITNLHNPSGALTSDENLRTLAALVQKAGALLLVDEVYGDYIPQTLRPGPAASLDSAIISVNSLTKVYGLSSLKCGWMIAASHVIDRIRPVYANYETGLSKITHAYATLVFDHFETYTAHWRDVLTANRPHVRHFAEEMQSEGLIEGAVADFGAMYFPRLIRHSDTRAFCAWAWLRYELALAPGEYFDAAGHIRIGFGMSTAQLTRGLERLATALREARNAQL